MIHHSPALMPCKWSVLITVVALAIGISFFLTGCGGATAANANFVAPSDPSSNSAPNSAPANAPSAPSAPAPSAPAPQQPPAQPSQPASNPGQKTASNIQQMSGWLWCTAKMNGHPCASGLGNADSSMTPNQQSPSLSGSSSVFWLGGPTHYSNALWWRELGPDSQPTHFTYDLYFNIDNAQAAEALEFDVNQTISGTRYVFGTECSYHNTGTWQIWDSKRGTWFKTDVPCPQVSSKEWHHLTWQFERTGGKAHFIGVTVDGQYTSVDKYFDPGQYGSDGTSVAFQLDGDYRQTPYKVWVDQMSLTSW